MRSRNAGDADGPADAAEIGSHRRILYGPRRVADRSIRTVASFERHSQRCERSRSLGSDRSNAAEGSSPPE